MRRLALALVAAAGTLAAEDLFNGKNLDGWDIFLTSKGLNNDPDKVFTVKDGVIRASGTEFGFIITKKEYENYYLSCEFKWGEATFDPRKNKARDGGILYHVTGPLKVWPRSLEYQMIEGGSGDFWLVGGVGLTVKGVTRPVGAANHRFDRFQKGPWKDEVNFRDPNGDPEKPRGQWNKAEYWTYADGRVVHKLNGKLVNEGSGLSDRKGKILFQSEGAEVFYRKIVVKPLK